MPAMSIRAFHRPSNFICRYCVESLGGHPRNSTTTAARFRIPRVGLNTTKPRRYATATVTSPNESGSVKEIKVTGKRERFWENEWTIYSASNEALVRKAQEYGNAVLTSKAIPTEDETLNALQIIDSAAKQLVYDAKVALEKSSELTETTIVSPTSAPGSSSPASILLALDSKQSDANPMSISISVDLLSKLAYKIVAFPPVFLNPKILETYISIQTTLHRPASFPEVFFLYGNKDTPVPESSDPIKYRRPNPNAASQAIPAPVANDALDAAIQAKDLDLALDIIDTTFATKAFHRAKFVRKALPPITGLSAAPVLAYIVGSQLSSEVAVVDPTQFTMIAFAGILTYVGAVTTLGFVAITSSNDQMERVSWAQGTPLRERWLREEERAAVDRLAMAWGFKQAYKRGDEEGVEWDALKEWCGLRGMELDRTDLMEGME